MLKFKVAKDVKNDVIDLKDISVMVCGMYLQLVDVKHDVFVEKLEYLRNSLWYMTTIADIGLFTDIKGNSGIVTVTHSSITFYLPEIKKQNLHCKNSLISIAFPDLKTKAFLDSELLNNYSPKLDYFYIKDISFIADNGIVFTDGSKFYSLIF